MFSIVGMSKRQLLALCVCIALFMFQGAVTVGLLPVYAVHLGANSAMTGLFLSIAFTTLTLGNIIGGWLADRLNIRKPILIVCYVLWIPAALLMTQAKDIQTLILTTGLLWFPGGASLAMLNIITGLSAQPEERGKVFGWTAVAMGAGGLLAGTIGGPIAERWGFPTLFVVMAAATAVKLVIAIFIQDKPAALEALQAQSKDATPNEQQARMGYFFYLLLAANLLAGLGMVAGGLGSPLVMVELGYDAAAVSSVIAVSSLITLPLPLILGWLSDRAGRKRFIVICYAVGALGILMLVPAAALWQFWLSACLGGFGGAARGVLQAFVADLVPPGAMGRGLALLNTTTMISGVFGNGGAGYVMDSIGIRPTLLLSTGIIVVAIALLVPLRRAAPAPIAVTEI